MYVQEKFGEILVVDGGVGHRAVCVLAMNFVWRWGVGSTVKGHLKDQRLQKQLVLMKAYVLSMDWQHLPCTSQHFVWKHPELTSCLD